MTKLYLITGFLGAGKTTFLKAFVGLFRGQKIALLINEFGKVSVDAALVSDLKASLAEVHGGSIFCACRLEQFEKGLAELVSQSPDVILVEASGLSDPTTIDSILSNKERYSQVEYRGCICLADAANFLKVITTAKVSRKQLDVCDLVVINKTDLVTKEQLQSVAEKVRELRPDVAAYQTVNGKIKREWMDGLVCCHSKQSDTVRTKDVSLHSRTLYISHNITREILQMVLEILSPCSYRIKGFVVVEGEQFLVDCVSDQISTALWSGRTEDLGTLVVLSGAGLATDKAIDGVLKRFSNFVSLMQ